MYPVSTSPGYRTAHAITCSAAVVVSLAATVLRTLLIWLNGGLDNPAEGADAASIMADMNEWDVPKEGAREGISIQNLMPIVDECGRDLKGT